VRLGVGWRMAVAVIMMRVVMVVVIVVLAHASVPLEGSAICSSISFSTPLIWASAAE
jgi:cytochrome c oxidase assembly protein Cox11